MQRAAVAGSDGDTVHTSTGNRRLTKRRKWQSKWQSRRHRRKEAQRAGNEGDGGSKGVEVQSHGETRRQKRQSESRCSDTKQEVKRRCRRPTEDSVDEQTSIRKRRHGQVRGRRSRDDKEERQFSEMVRKYRQKMEAS